MFTSQVPFSHAHRHTHTRTHMYNQHLPIAQHACKTRAGLVDVASLHIMETQVTGLSAIHTHMHADTNTHTHTHTHTYTCRTHVDVASLHIMETQVASLPAIHTHIYADTNTHIHIDTHTHTPTQQAIYPHPSPSAHTHLGTISPIASLPRLGQQWSCHRHQHYLPLHHHSHYRLRQYRTLLKTRS